MSVSVINQQKQKLVQQQAIVQQAVTQHGIQTAPWQQPQPPPAVTVQPPIIPPGAAAPIQQVVPIAAPPPTPQHIQQLEQQLEQTCSQYEEQILQSEGNLKAQYQSLMQQQKVYQTFSTRTKFVVNASLNIFLLLKRT